MPLVRVVALQNFLLVLLAAAGIVALGTRLLGSLFRLGLTAAEKTHNDALVDASLRQGDLTALAERRAAAGDLRRSRARSGLLVVLWLALLVVPPIFGWGREVYAAAALLWFLPGRPALPRPPVRR
ncbi:MAG TPA: hypothetical protein VHG51_09780 [Longimicrobiaceae bacterium]|nr:hypothetical protein [Longimicrobiaceae bacterium]